jgi:hypothetical protein
MRRRYAILAALAVTLGLPPETRAEAGCALTRAPEGSTLTDKGRIKSSDWDRAHDGYAVTVALAENCQGVEVNMIAKQRPRCGVGALVSVTGRYSRADGHSLQAPRIVCTK